MTNTVDYGAITQRQQRVWSNGDFARMAGIVVVVAEQLVENADLSSRARVLDIAGGSGNAALAAARRFCDVTCTDYVPELLEVAKRRAEAEYLEMKAEPADAQALPYADASFDVVLSVFGIMFAPDQEKAAAELLRVTKPGGTIALASWTPTGFTGDLFRLQSKYMPPPPGLRPAVEWGTEARVRELLGSGVRDVRATVRQCVFRFRSPEHMFEHFTTWFGPARTLMDSLDDAGRETLRRESLELYRAKNTAKDGSLRVPSDYLEVLATRA